SATSTPTATPSKPSKSKGAAKTAGVASRSSEPAIANSDSEDQGELSETADNGETPTPRTPHVRDATPTHSFTPLNAPSKSPMPNGDKSKDKNELGDGIEAVSDDDVPNGNLHAPNVTPLKEKSPSSHRATPSKSSSTAQKSSESVTPAPKKQEAPVSESMTPTPTPSSSFSQSQSNKPSNLSDVNFLLYVTVASPSNASPASSPPEPSGKKPKKQTKTVIPLTFTSWPSMKDTILEELPPKMATAFDKATLMTIAVKGGKIETKVKIAGVEKFMVDKAVASALGEVMKASGEDAEEVECEVRFE
ncbi:MAG: hypothetical protein Q9162_006437, partial [Coniocarpon cinnabarinum]